MMEGEEKIKGKLSRRRCKWRRLRHEMAAATESGGESFGSSGKRWRQKSRPRRQNGGKMMETEARIFGFAFQKTDDVLLGESAFIDVDG